MVAPLIPAILGLAQFAPSLMRFLGAGEKSAAVADQVAQIAQSVTGTSSPEEALAAMRESAHMAQAFNLAVLQADTELERAYLVDRQDARSRDVKLAQAGMRNVRADVMVLIDAVGLVTCLLVLVFKRGELSGEVVALISTIASIFGLCLRDAHQFEFGSSRGSREKDQLMARPSGEAPSK